MCSSDLVRVQIKYAVGILFEKSSPTKIGLDCVMGGYRGRLCEHTAYFLEEICKLKIVQRGHRPVATGGV